METGLIQLSPGTAIAPERRVYTGRFKSYCLQILTLRSLALLLAFGLVLVSKSQAQTGAQSREPVEITEGEIVDVKFEGNKDLTDGEIRSVVATKTSSGLEVFLNGFISTLGAPRQEVDIPTLSRDTAAIVQFYKDHGYLGAHASYEVRTSPQELVEWERTKRAYNPNTKKKERSVLKDTVIFHIFEGPRSNISGISFMGLEDLPNEFQPELTEKVTLKVDSPYLRANVVHEVNRIRGVLEENGYPFFAHDSIVVERNKKTKGVHVLMFFSPGPRYRYGDVIIKWDTAGDESRVSERVIRAQLRLDSGNWYKASDIQHSVQNLYRLNVFEIVRLNFDTTSIANIPREDRDSLAVPMILELRTKSRAEMTPGVFAGSGYNGGTDLGLNLNYFNRNLFGGAENFRIQSSYQFSPFVSWSIGGEYTEPYLFSMDIPFVGERNIPLIVAPNYSIKKDTTAEEEAWSARFGSNVNITDNGRSNISADLINEYYQLRIRDSISYQKQNSRQILQRLNQLNMILSLSTQLDRTTDIFNPIAGHFLSVSAELGTPFLATIAGSDLPSAAYSKEVVHGKYFYDLSNRGISIFATRARLGFSQLFKPSEPGHDIPLSRRFFAGGSNSMRGWAPRSLLVSNDSGKLADQNGGYTLLEYTAEWRFSPFKPVVEVTTGEKLLSPLSLALFFEAGNVWDKGTKITLNSTALTVGTGLRYNLFFGAFRFDLGWKLYDPHPNPQRGVFEAASPDDKGVWITKRSFFRDGMQVWFGIGQAF